MTHAATRARHACPTAQCARAACPRPCSMLHVPPMPHMSRVRAAPLAPRAAHTPRANRAAAHVTVDATRLCNPGEHVMGSRWAQLRRTEGFLLPLVKRLRSHLPLTWGPCCERPKESERCLLRGGVRHARACTRLPVCAVCLSFYVHVESVCVWPVQEAAQFTKRIKHKIKKQLLRPCTHKHTSTHDST